MDHGAKIPSIQKPEYLESCTWIGKRLIQKLKCHYIFKKTFKRVKWSMGILSFFILICFKGGYKYGYEVKSFLRSLHALGYFFDFCPLL